MNNTNAIERVIAPGGQVPLLKHAIMQWLQSHEGRIPGDSYTLAEVTKAAVPNVVRALYDLQKQGLVTFKERKNEGTNGHHSTVLTHFGLTPTGMRWTAERAVLTDLPSISTNSPEDINPALFAATDVDDVATDMGMQRVARAIESHFQVIEDHLDGTTQAWVPDDSPVGLLVNLLKAGPMSFHDINKSLGYANKSTAVYSIAAHNPGGFDITKGIVTFIGGPAWRPSPTHTRTGRGKGTPKATWHLDPDRRMHLYKQGDTVIGEVEKVGDGFAWAIESNGRGGILPTFGAAKNAVENGRDGTEYTWDPVVLDTPLAREARASVELDGETQSMPDLGPELTALVARATKREKVAQAVALLEAAGLDEDALSAMTRIPDDSALEVEVLALLHSLGHGPKDV